MPPRYAPFPRLGGGDGRGDRTRTLRGEQTASMFLRPSAEGRASGGRPAAGAERRGGGVPGLRAHEVTAGQQLNVRAHDPADGPTNLCSLPAFAGLFGAA